MKPEETPAPKESPNKSRLVTVLLQLLLSIAVLGGGVALATYFLKTGPEAKPRKRQPSPPLVQVITLKNLPHQLQITGLGTILAAKEINLTPGVGGEIVEMSDLLVPGGFFAKNEPLVSVDPTDYKLAILQLESEVAKARSDIDLEMGNQYIAKKEYEILGQKVSKAEKKLMLREPQLETKKATLHGIQARLAQAELNLKRTKVTAPFNGVVLSRSVNLGTRVSESTVIGKLVGTDEFWLKLAIPVDQLKWIVFPGDGSKQGSEVKIFLQGKADGIFRTGRVVRLAADLENQGRMAAVYVAVRDPLSLLPDNKKKPRLLLGSFVRADIKGITLSSVVPINRDHLRDGNTVWLLKDDNTLEIRPIDVAARTRNQILIGSGITDGEKLIISGLSAPVPGIPVKVLQEGINKDHSNRPPAGKRGDGHGEANR
jgi:RND family efflux transporter MFP subunit